MTTESLSEIKRAPLAVVLGAIADANPDRSKDAGMALCREAKRFGLNTRDYLTLAVDVQASTVEQGGKTVNPYRLADGSFMSGYEAAIVSLNLPFKNDFKQGILLEAAADTFSARPGSRALFPEVIDDMMTWATRQDQLENTAGMVAQSRTIRGPELITQAIFDDEGNTNSTMIAELANIPVQTIKSTDRSVRFYKFGSAIRTSYEFERRVSMDVLTPYANRIARKLEIDKVGEATRLLINGDGVHSPAATANLAAFESDMSGDKTLKDNYVALMRFLVSRAKDGIPVDTIVGNFDMFVELFLMFTPTVNQTSVYEALAEQGAPRVALNLPVMQGVTFQLSSTCPPNTLIAYSRGDTLEELIEEGSSIAESEQAIRNQSITYVRTQNAGYRLVYGDTRTVLTIN